MNRLDRTTLNKLMNYDKGLAVTIYVPMHTTASPPHITENQIRIKNLFHRAMELLPKGDVAAKVLKTQLDELYDDYEFWENHQMPGLLICASADGLELFDLPIDTEEYVAVDTCFHLAPIIGLLHDARDFYVLALAQRNPFIYKGSLFGLEPSGIKLPASAKEALNIDEVNQKLESQGTATGPSSNGAAGAPSFVRGWFNGRGGSHNTAAEEKLRYFRIVDHVIFRAADRTLPLVLAGTEEDIAHYSSVSHYPHILKETIPGNHAADNPRALFEAAQAVIWRELVVPDHTAAVNEYHHFRGVNPERVAHTLKTIREAAAQGRVDKLFARLIARTADTVRDKLDDVPRITFPNPSESKHLNDVVLNVWRGSGTIYTLLPNEMPNGELMAAHLRY